MISQLRDVLRRSNMLVSQFSQLRKFAGRRLALRRHPPAAATPSSSPSAATPFLFCGGDLFLFGGDLFLSCGGDSFLFPVGGDAFLCGGSGNGLVACPPAPVAWVPPQSADVSAADSSSSSSSSSFDDSCDELAELLLKSGFGAALDNAAAPDDAVLPDDAAAPDNAV